MIKLKKLSIDGIDYTDYAVWTLQGQETLDESLDLNYIELKGTNIELPFKPFLDVDIQIDDGMYGYRVQRLVESDTVKEVTSNNTFNHDLLLIEETKWLERLFVEKTIRQPLIHDYSELGSDVFVVLNREYAYGSGTKVDQASDNINLFGFTMEVNQTYTIDNPAYLMKQFEDKFDFEMGLGYISDNTKATLNIYAPSGELVFKKTSKRFVQDEYGNNIQNRETFEFTPLQEGSYTFNITAHGYGYVAGENKSIDSTAEFGVSVFIKDSPKEDYTIRDVINQLLETCITLRESEEPLFKIAEPNNYSNASEDYKKQVQAILDTVSPEFTFNKMSLFEALKMIGDFAHFIPRLQNRKIYFDLLGQNEKAGIDFLGQYCSNVSAQGSNDFCNALDSQVNNLTCMDDVKQGSVSTPDNTGYRTLRTESGDVQITDQNIIIPTEENIEEIVALEIGYLNDDTYVGDITSFVYEEDEYNTLSSYSSAFPTSKMFAIKYKQGAKNITGLSWKRQNAVSGSFENIAIKNIIYRKLGKDINWWNNFWNNDDVMRLQYRLVYIPSVNTKVTQFKNNIEDISSKPLYIAYNQSASKVSSNAYGENLKGTIAKLGNVAKTKMYILPTFDLIPKCGTLFDKDYYISVVKYEVYPNFIKCEVGLSKNYNNKSAYVEINSQLEFFEYNRNITIDRYIVYDDFCEIMDRVDDLTEPSNALITEKGLDMLYNNFVYEGENYPVGLVKAQGYSERSGALTEVVLPVISLGVGNSLLFSFHYEDTISAGTKAFNSGAGRYQYSVKYTDIYGEVDKLKLSFGMNNVPPENYTDAVNVGDNIPLTSYTDEDGNNVDILENMNTYFTTKDDKIKLFKGVGENPHFTYQIHFVTNNPDYVIGSGLTRKSIFTTSERLRLKLYGLKEEINKFETKIDLTNATEIGRLDENGVGLIDDVRKIMKLNNKIAPDGTYKAWAIVQTLNDSNDLILGKNIEFVGGDTLIMPAFVFKRRIK